MIDIIHTFCRRILLTRIFADALEKVLQTFDIQKTFEGVGATMTAEGLPEGVELSFQSLKSHKKHNPDYVFTYGPEDAGERQDVCGDDSDDDNQQENMQGGAVSDPEELLDTAENPNSDPEEIIVDAGEEQNSGSSEGWISGDEYISRKSFPQHLRAAWNIVPRTDAIRSSLTVGTTIAHVFSTGWATGIFKGHVVHRSKSIQNVPKPQCFVRYGKDTWTHDLDNSGYGTQRNWVILKKKVCNVAAATTSTLTASACIAGPDNTAGAAAST